jgi:hypothetical protein
MSAWEHRSMPLSVYVLRTYGIIVIANHDSRPSTD